MLPLHHSHSTEEVGVEPTANKRRTGLAIQLCHRTYHLPSGKWRNRTPRSYPSQVFKTCYAPLRATIQRALAVLTAFTSLFMCPEPVAVRTHKITLQRFLQKLGICPGLKLPQTKGLGTRITVVKVVHKCRTEVPAVNTLCAMVGYKLLLCVLSPTNYVG